MGKLNHDSFVIESISYKFKGSHEAAREALLDSAMIRKDRISLEEIAHYVPVLSLEELEELEVNTMQLHRKIFNCIILAQCSHGERQVKGMQ